jgi:hypothetical protein
MSFAEDAPLFANSISGGADFRYDLPKFAFAHAKLFGAVVHLPRLGHVDLAPAGREPLPIILSPEDRLRVDFV